MAITCPRVIDEYVLCVVFHMIYIRLSTGSLPIYFETLAPLSARLRDSALKSLVGRKRRDGLNTRHALVCLRNMVHYPNG